MKKIYNYIAVFSTISVLTILFFYFQSVNSVSNIVEESPYTLKVLSKEDFWIYEVYNKDNLFIRQEYIPAANGKQVFQSKEDAEKMGKVVIAKLAHDRFPVINLRDLQNNNINFKKI
ncbi:DUF4907 domain-containing protein [Oceanihabitans sp. 2_MG-2023]|uniref:DUF4907 domain-containing protein n=1 Tax=Oceanihabitans sp. 2_MG-2023 TaxID=3062661 RepID=UPI0026E36F7A|nr:DUF4907 domain-containing protein [Oceanihabitans sp. 2_MG-2023]MDO6596628.1 DUF4907 domain-containing protein [Oceanihabitans sp. 2_MG-2023]